MEIIPGSPTSWFWCQDQNSLVDRAIGRCVHMCYFFLLLIDILQGNYWFTQFSPPPRNNYWGSKIYTLYQRSQAITLPTLKVTLLISKPMISPKLQNEETSARGCKQESFIYSRKRKVIPERRLNHSILLGSEVNNTYIIRVMQTLATYVTKNK